MEKAWWEVQDPGDAAGSGSDMNDELLRPLPDKDFETDAHSVISVFVRFLVFGIPAIGILWFFIDFNAPIYVWLFCGIPTGLCSVLVFLSSLSTRRLRVQHSINRLVIEYSSGAGSSSEERPLSEAAYLEYTKSKSKTVDIDGNNTTITTRRYIVHGHSSEGEEWKLGITGLVFSFGNHRRKAEEIADAIGIEFRG